jgi:hypothetical protein
VEPEPGFRRGIDSSASLRDEGSAGIFQAGHLFTVQFAVLSILLQIDYDRPSIWRTCKERAMGRRYRVSDTDPGTDHLRHLTLAPILRYNMESKTIAQEATYRI